MAIDPRSGNGEGAATEPLKELKPLLDLAKSAARRAYAPYSKFPVGAAVVTDDGRMYSGCNIENASYGLSMCAERVAIFSAVAAGDKWGVRSLVLYTPTDRSYTPCGACRQVLAEFAREDPHIICCSDSGETLFFRLSELFPKGFSL